MAGMTPDTAQPTGPTAPTAVEHWSLHAQVQTMQQAINGLVNGYVETQKRSTSTEEYAKQRVAQADTNIEALRVMVTNMKMDDVV